MTKYNTKFWYELKCTCTFEEGPMSLKISPDPNCERHRDMLRAAMQPLQVITSEFNGIDISVETPKAKDGK